MSFQDPAQPPTTESPTGYALPVTPLPSPTVAPLIAADRRRTSALSLLLGFALVVAIGGVAFAAGRLTAPVTAAATGTRGGNGTGLVPGASGAPGTGTGANRFGAGGLGAGAGVSIQGTVQSVSATSMTILLSSGQTIDIPLDGSTTYHGQTTATPSDVKTGAQVVVELAGTGFGGHGGGTGGSGGAPGTGGAPGAVGSPGAVPSAGAAASPAASGGTRITQPGAIGPARDVTVVTP